MNQENHQSGFDGSVGALDDEYRDIFAVKKVAAERAVAGGSEKQVGVGTVDTLKASEGATSSAVQYVTMASGGRWLP
ncbi:hypothetical protein [Burkholderia pseudomallei]|uniref:hypothetical protein n=1 Tax=Burkholderia pseudomallei TaxID=28450 RepID=UPI000F1BC6BA|nr:hypothetical protein [Burkholderia pseudomallei]VBE89887.1 Uncharacterised protein [Burkholderia pseudomallei]